MGMINHKRMCYLLIGRDISTLKIKLFLRMHLKHLEQFPSVLEGTLLLLISLLRLEEASYAYSLRVGGILCL